ncbi:CRISPR-associated endoribonuclease Cas6 [Effusibacillus lacus]|uniref:CRISPR-associated endoribonuclease n=1 Tax=Effusibacillus lacus TaxID=1348429 RepID=A0A292YQL0_9BACL|nr:CRISPR-associated endoribonuclease Cas6 [Effusibacillus lacus]TCS68777.1 CRISPR-associated Cas6 family protein [Effusibacillus lacus]GAX90694.1 CRISPR-associated endoribonuclease Cas6 [Effusibacillus lacus]
MRFKITLEAVNDFVSLPLQHNEFIQAAIYSSLSPDFAAFLHDKGYRIDNRRFTLFAFSRIMGTYQILRERKQIHFSNPIQLVVSSPVQEFIRDMAQLLLKDGFRIGSQYLRVTGMEIQEPKVEQEEIVVHTLSPVVAYSTLLRPDGNKYTLYFEPGESDFRRIVTDNLLRKGRLIYGEEVDFHGVQVEPVGHYKRHIVMYKDSAIKGYSGKFRLKGDRRLLQTAIDAGLGSKNAMGFGLVEV